MRTRWLKYLLPGTCLACGGAADADLGLCEFCRSALPWNGSCCPRCANPRVPGLPAHLPCPACQDRPPAFDGTLAPLLYEGLPGLWVRRLKDHSGMVEGHVLGMLLADAAASWYADGLRTPPQLLMPVPLTWRRLAQRGHNQALTLARPVARLLGVPLWRLGAKRQAGEHQRGSSRGQRLRNPAGVFATRHRWIEPGPCIAIVDDVMTTGATAAALARVLLAAGASEVHVLCATRTRP